MQKDKDKSTRKRDTFYSSFKQYEAAVVTTGLAHYMGKGVETHNGLGPSELDAIKRHTMKSAKRVSTVSADRGLISTSQR
jgi:hypothetical protein